MAKTILFVGLFVLFPAKSAGFYDCNANQEILPSCESMRSSHGFTYTVPSSITSRGCEQGWYFQNGTFIVDSTPNASGERSHFVVDVTPRNLTVRACENLQWQLNCGTCYSINYTVTDLKPSPANDLQDDGNHNGNAGLPQWVIALIVIALIAGAALAILFCHFRNKKRASCCSDSNQDAVI